MREKYNYTIESLQILPSTMDKVIPIIPPPPELPSDHVHDTRLCSHLAAFRSHSQGLQSRFTTNIESTLLPYKILPWLYREDPIPNPLLPLGMTIPNPLLLLQGRIRFCALILDFDEK